MTGSHLIRAELVKSRLLSKQTIKVKNEWIVECVKFFISQNPSIDDENLFMQALEQFLLGDMKDSSNPVIPATIQQKKETFTLYGTFVMQLIYLIEITEPPYEQWRKLHNKKLDEVEDNRESKTFQTKKKRIFKLELTDGHKKVTAMEFMICPFLNTKISPGVKLQIVGPLRVINHILFLEPKNLNVLGGDVESLVIVNAYENILLEALGKPKTDTPITDYTEDQPLSENVIQRGYIEPKPFVLKLKDEMKAQADQLLAGINFDEEEDVDMETLMKLEEEGRNFKVQEVPKKEPSFDDYDEDFLAEVDFNSIENEARQQIVEKMEVCDAPGPSRNNQPMKANDLLIPPMQRPPDEDDFDELSWAQTESRRPDESSDDIIPKKVARIEPMNVHEPADDFYRFKSNQGDNILTVDQYVSLKTGDKIKKHFVIKAKFERITENSIKCRSQGWKLTGELTDDHSTKTLQVTMHSAILDDLAGNSGPKMRLLFEETKQKPAMKGEIQKIIERLQQKLAALDCFMKIKHEVNLNSKVGTQIVELLVNDDNMSSYNRKLKEEKLLKVK